MFVSSLLSPSGITRLVDRMIVKKLLRRETDPTDGRVALATLTEEGLRLVRLAARTHLRGIRQHFSGRLSDPQLRAVASALETIVGPTLRTRPEQGKGSGAWNRLG